MNDPNKAISVNLSSLLSLKAELLRKQNEVKVAKSTNTISDEFATNKNKSNSEELKKKKHERLKAISQTEDAKTYETEDSGQLEKSRRVLEAKSKYYDRMSRVGGTLNSDDNCLVMFNRKRQENNSVQDQRVIESSSESDYEPDDAKESPKGKYNEDDVEDEDDWVEFTDCLGRTRTCLRKDLADAKRRDKELAESMPERLDQTKANWMIDTKGTLANNNSDGDDDDTYGPKPTESVFSEGLSTMSKLEEQRVNWELKEQENFDKPDVHYQDVFFDEARMHGVSYYAFSTDVTERKKQQKDLDVARKATLAEQKKRDALRAERDRIVSERVFAAKNRIRARNGLPPMTREEFEKEFKTPKENEEKSKKLERKERKRTLKQQQAKEKEEAEREQQRQEHVRPWDKEKVGISKTSTTNPEKDTEPEEEWQYKAERLPMSQAEWNDQQRSLRIPEFGPIPEDTSEQSLPKRTNFTCMPPPPAPAMARMHAGTEFTEFAPFQSTKRTFQRRNYTTDVDHTLNKTSIQSQRGAAIPPPENLDTDYALPVNAKRPKTNDDLSRSIEAGLRFLRDQSDKGHTGSKASWSAKADY